ncbi:pantothenate kinase [Tumidithrix helvetica PCC 7403]|uniref:pantothenate kinase n=1 Tax=Tumidithrix helvetica TaxID=3457545 RepID=UPI003CC2E695
MPNRQWLAIAIGNTRLQAGVFQDSDLIANYACKHDEISLLAQQLAELFPDIHTASQFVPIAIASVVPDLITPWHGLPQTQIVTTQQIPIQGIYASMGVDRALALWGAIVTYGLPMLVVDAGTAMTFTGVDAANQFVGGAILPGLRTQMQSLQTATAALPSVDLPTQLPPRWAIDTISAIQSGVAYSAIASVTAFVQDWRSRFPHSHIVVTGGDGERFYDWGIFGGILDWHFDPNLIFWGVREYWKSLISD